MKFAITIVALAAAGGASIVVGQRIQPPTKQVRDPFAIVRDFIKTRMVRDRIPSVAVAVAHHRKIVWEEGFGFANLAKRTRATSHTVYRICSISKVFTAVAIMILVERGRLDLDRPINDYLGKVKLKAKVGDANDATVRRLANHTSGLPLHEQIYYEGESYKPTPSDRIEEQIARYGNIVWKPGERPQYSNLGSGILGHVVSRQSGMSFTAFMRKEIFLPLRLTRSSVRLSKELRPFTAIGYVDGKPVPLVTNSTPGAGEVWCSAHDLVRFGMFHLKDHLPDQKPILRDKALDAMQVTTSKVPGSDFAIGWGTDDNYRGTGYRAVGHHGGNIGWFSLLVLIPSEDLAVAVLANSNGDIVDPVADKVIAALIPDYGKRRTALIAKRANQKKATKPSNAVFKPPVSLIGEWRGSIHTFEGKIQTTFWFDKNGAYARIGKQEKLALHKPSFNRGFLTADLGARLLTADTRRQLPGILEIDLKLRGNRLNGVVYANSLYGNPAYGGYRLNHWVELKKIR